MPSLRHQLLRRKPVAAMTAESGTDTDEGELSRSLGLFQLSLFGIGGTIGTGIFIVLSQAVPIAGPSVVISFIFAAVVAGLTAICYAELAGAVPVSGSSYSYAYATLGEGVAIVVGACLLLEYGVSAAAVAVGWSEYLNELFNNLFGFVIPDALSNAPEQGGVFNVPAVVLILLCTLLLIRGASESAKVNSVMVLIKIGVLVLFIGLGIQGWNSDNLADFAPFGADGITAAAGIIFFSFIGLDAVSTAGEEVRNPRRNLPLAILIALVVVTSLYVAVAIVAVAAQPVAGFEGQEAGLAAILEDVTGASWPGSVLAAGAVVSIFSVVLVVIYAQTRILFAMGRDGMVPAVFHRLNPRTLTPVTATIIVAVVISLLAGLVPIDFLAEMTSIGTLAAFLVVSIGVMVLRQREPDLPRGFKVPLYPVTPILSIAGCLWIILDLRTVTIVVFFAWAGVALLWYLAYGRRHSAVGKLEAAGRGNGMTIVVGVETDRREQAALHLAALHLAAMLARSEDDDIVLCAVVLPPWPLSPAKVGAEYRAELERVARAALDEDRARMPADVDVTTVVHHARSAPAGLLEVADQHEPAAIVVGSSSAGGVGRVAVGSVSGRLMHSSPVPLALPPRGFRAAPDARVARVTAAYGGSEEADELLAQAAAAAVRLGASLRLASFAVRPRSPYTTGVGRDADDAMVKQWADDTEASGRAALARIEDRSAVPDEIACVVGHGERWETALEDVEWRDGDVLVVGSSSSGPVKRVFLGSRATKIVRASPVPVMVVPRG